MNETAAGLIFSKENCSLPAGASDTLDSCPEKQTDDESKNPDVALTAEPAEQVFFKRKRRGTLITATILKANKKTKGGGECSRRAFVLKIVSLFMLQNMPALQATQSVDFLDSQSNF